MLGGGVLVEPHDGLFDGVLGDGLEHTSLLNAMPCQVIGGAEN